DVRAQTVHAALAAEAGLLVAAERRRGVELVERVRPDDAGAHLRGDLEDLGSLVGPDTGGEAVRNVVRLLDGLLGRAARHHRENRPEDLLARDPMGLRDAGEERRGKEVPLRRDRARRLVDLSALFDTR